MNPIIGLFLAILAGAINGTFSLPMKKTTKWEWENTWLVFSIVGMLVICWAIAFVTVPDLMQVLQRSGTKSVAVVFLFGFAWSVASVLFGIGVYMIGMSLTFSIATGISAALGSLIPMALKPSTFLTPCGKAIVLGIVTLLAGVAFCAVAGLRKDAQIRKMSGEDSKDAKARSGVFLKGLICVIMSGLLDPTLNFSFTFPSGEHLKATAVSMGASPLAATDAVWAVAILGAFIGNAAYCVYLLQKNRTWSKFLAKKSGSHWGLAAVMGLFWMASLAVYGRAASLMGVLGGSVGWAVFYCAIIIFSSMWGVITGEWDQGRGRPLRTMYVGLAVLLIAIIVLGYGNSLQA